MSDNLTVSSTASSVIELQQGDHFMIPIVLSSDATAEVQLSLSSDIADFMLHDGIDYNAPTYLEEVIFKLLDIRECVLMWKNEATRDGQLFVIDKVKKSVETEAIFLSPEMDSLMKIRGIGHKFASLMMIWMGHEIELELFYSDEFKQEANMLID